jgi:hypothetical protein
LQQLEALGLNVPTMMQQLGLSPPAATPPDAPPPAVVKPQRDAGTRRE